VEKQEMPVKISIIGAGSAMFSLSLIRDLCLTPNLAGSTVTFMDIDEARLDAAHALCARYASEVGNALTLEKTTDRQRALEGSDFVVNTALVAGHDRLRAGWDVARRHGYRMGGSLHVMHDEAFWINFYQFRLFESVMEDILRICPDAWYLKVDNPVFAGITHLGRRYPQAKIVGLCHGFAGVYHIADALGLPHEGLTYEIPGVNHFVWLTHLYHNGEDVLPRLDAWIENGAAAWWAAHKPSDYLGPKAIDLYRRFGVFPIGDTCTTGGGSWPFWYHTDDATQAQWLEDPDGWYRDYFGYLDSNISRIRRASQDMTRPVTEEFRPRMSGEVMVPLIEAIACDMPRVVIGNVMNHGDYVPGVPRDIAVEIPLYASKRGIAPVQTNGLPRPLIDFLLRDRVASIEVELEAFTTGSRARLLDLIMMDPWTRSLGQASALLDDILALPFHADMRAHYR
jgi:alpha-galactosidase